MATRIELPKEMVKGALETKIASTKRAVNSATNAIIKDALEKEHAALNAALSTITEIK